MLKSVLLPAFALASSLVNAQCEISLNCPPNLELSCTQDNSPETAGYPEVIGVCPGELSYEDMTSGDECLTVITRYWTWSNDGLDLASCSQIIIVADDLPPVFVDFPELVSVPCGEDLPEPEGCPAIDECTALAVCEGFSVQTGFPVDSCVLSTGMGPGPDWDIWVPGTPAPVPFYQWDTFGTMVLYLDGSAHITGLVRNILDPALAFQVDMWLDNGMDWAEWSGLGRAHKDDLNIAGINYLDWSYFELVDGFSRLIGADDLEGSVLYLSHAPESYYFGYQSGVAANNHNTEDGISGWFTYSGTWNGETIEGEGDLRSDKSCSEVEINECAANTAFTYFWRAVDVCGNEAFASQSVSSFDNEAPVFISGPEDVTVNCSELPYISEFPVAVDNCPGEIVVLEPDEELLPAECPLAFELLRTWVALDACGNAASFTQRISVIDDTAPVFAETEEYLELDCAPGDGIYAFASDACTVVTITFTDEPVEDACAGSVIRSYVASDACGNTSGFTQTIIVTDNEAPVFVETPEDGVYNCYEIPEAVNPSIVYSDNCQDLDLDWTEEVIAGDCPHSYTLVRNYTLSDACGNSASFTWTLSIQDNQAPVLLNVPEDEVLGCGDQPADALVFAVDLCDPEPVISMAAETVEIECGYVLTRTWTATDACGNTFSQTQTVQFLDQQAPQFTEVPEDIEIACDEQIPFGQVAATDDCNNVNISFTDLVIPGLCAGNYTVERTFLAVDDCGNEAFYTQIIAVSDISAPVFSNTPEAIEATCDDFNDLPAAQASDNCGEVTLEFEDVELESVCPYQIQRTWTATDDCGNASEFVQIITLLDTEAPEFLSFPEDITLQCSDALPGINEGVSYSDNCSETLLLAEETVSPGDCPDSFSIVRTYTISDACGNSALASYTITVVDTEAPVMFGVPQDETINCDEEVSDALVFALDNCDDFVDISLTATTQPLECGYLFIRTWTATDNCGNSISQTQTVTVTDTEAPVFVETPEDLTLACDEEIPVTNAEASDNCSEVDLGYTDTVVPGDCQGSYTIERVFTAVDECGNISAYTQIITVIDEVAPEFQNTPLELSTDCDELNALPAAEAVDNCGTATLSYDDSEPVGECPYQIFRTWTATDDCGNSSQLVQIITVFDNDAPVFTQFPEDVTVQCDQVLPDPNAGLLYEDNCSDVSLSLEETVSPGDCPGSFSVIRMYTITDACGNSTSSTWTISVVDTEAPVLLGVPDDETISCTEEVSDAIVFGIDNCDNFVEISLTATTEPLECGFLFIRTWTGVDDCGNEVSATQTVTVIDDTDPYLSYFPENIFLNCGDPIPEPDDVEILDDCDDDPQLEITELIEGDPYACPLTIIRIYRGFDCAGNYTIYAQYIFFTDEDDIMMPEAKENIWISGIASDPASEQFQVVVHANASLPYRLDVLDLNGRVLSVLGDFESSPGIISHELYTGNLVSGIYFVRLTSGEHQSLKRIPVLR